MRSSNFRIFSLLSLLALAGALPACDDVPVDDGDPGEVELRPFGCSWCGLQTGNSPIINGASLPHWYLDRPFANGHQIGPGSSANKVAFRLDVDPAHDRFIGRAPVGGAVILSGTDLLGASFSVVSGDLQSVSLTITDIDTNVASWSDNGTKITAYRASYRDAQQVVQPLCPAADASNQWFTLIVGERYDSGTNEVIAAAGSVTIACVGEAAAKMKLMDYHPNGNRQASPAERQATLRMITADYCGTGQSFTVAGTPVAWRDAAGAIEPVVHEGQLEALWDADGAICLNAPRYASMKTVLAACGELPICASDDFIDGVVWRTKLPN